MIIIEKDAEKKFLLELNQLKNSTGFRAIYYSFSQLPDEQKSIVQEAVTTSVIADLLHNPSAKAFTFQDSDVMILAPNLFSKTYNKLTYEISERAGIRNFVDYSKLYDLDENWPYLHKLVSDKYNSIRSKEQLELEKMRKQQESVKMEYILSAKNLDQDLLKSIDDRRTRRTGANILIVEDDAFSRKMIRNVLNKEYNVIDVEDGKDALASYVTTSPNVVFLDIDLPDVTGHDILQAVLKLDPNAYIVMLSGNADQENVLKAVQAGAKGFVAKPFKKDKLYHYIHQCPTIQKGI